MKWFSLLFIWMKFIHITKNDIIYTNKNILKYSIFFYLLKFIYPLWLILGTILNYSFFNILLVLELVKYLLFPFLQGKIYKWYELIESILSIILFIFLLF